MYKIRQLSLKFSVLLLMVFVFCSCSTAKEKVFERGGLTLKYINKVSRGNPVAKYRMDHPYKISENTMKRHLSSLTFLELSLMGKKKTVFQAKEVDEIAGLIARGVRNLKPKIVLYFHWEGPHGQTTGDVFVYNNELHFRFYYLQGMPFANANLNRWSSSTWRLLPQKGQAYHVTNKLLGDKADQNWIVSLLNVPETNRMPTAKGKQSPVKKRKSAPTKSSGSKADLEKKLKFLKELRQKDLIDEKEYQRKRKELIDTLL